MALSNQSELTAFFQFPACHFKNQPPHSFQPNNSGWWLADIGLIPVDVTENGRIAEDYFSKNGQIPEDDFTKISQIQAYDKPESARPRNINYRELVPPQVN